LTRVACQCSRSRSGFQSWAHFSQRQYVEALTLPDAAAIAADPQNGHRDGASVAGWSSDVVTRSPS
jgi:hypothetical protein